MLEQLKKKFMKQICFYPSMVLLHLRWGNVSAVDREKGLFVIKAIWCRI